MEYLDSEWSFCKISAMWKTSCLVLILMKSHPSSLNAYTPGALISHIIKIPGETWNAYLSNQISTSLDPIQCTYCPGELVGNAINSLLQQAPSYLDQVCSTDYACQTDDRFVRLKGCVPEKVVSITGSLQETELFLFFFTLFKHFQYRSECFNLQEYSDDSVVVECVSDGQEAEYRILVDHFVACCGINPLLLYRNKTVLIWSKHVYCVVRSWVPKCVLSGCLWLHLSCLLFIETTL